MLLANSFEKDCFKLMLNSMYAKIMGNLPKRVSARLANNEKDFLNTPAD